MLFDKPKIFKGEAGLIFAAIAGLVLSDIIPTPGDAMYFHLVKKWRDQWAKGELTAKQYWAREAAGYYLLNSSWWALVGLATYFTPGDFHKKLRTLIVLSGGGIVVAVLAKNIQKDIKAGLAEIQQEKEDLYQKNGKI